MIIWNEVCKGYNSFFYDDIWEIIYGCLDLMECKTRLADSNAMLALILVCRQTQFGRWDCFNYHIKKEACHINRIDIWAGDTDSSNSWLINSCQIKDTGIFKGLNLFNGNTLTINWPNH